jgi:hypothetical protein
MLYSKLRSHESAILAYEFVFALGAASMCCEQIFRKTQRLDPLYTASEIGERKAPNAGKTARAGGRL